MMTRTQIIEGILDLLDSPEKWCRQKAAQDAQQRHVDVWDDGAVAWCLAGAFAKVALVQGMTSYPQWVLDARSLIERRCLVEHGTGALPEVNDYRFTDYEDMRMFLKRALLEAEELDAK